MKSVKEYILASKGMFTLISILIGFFVGAIALLASGFNPFVAYGVIFWGVFGKVSYICYTIVKATPLILTGLSITFAFRTGLFNIGAEGQFIIGTIIASALGVLLDLPFYLHIPFVIIASILGAGIFGGIVGYLKATFGVHEVITSIMMNWIAFYLRNFFVVTKTLAKPISEVTHTILDSANLTFFHRFKMSESGIAWLNDHPFFKELLRAPVNLGFFIAIAVVILIWFTLNKTTLGYRLRAVGFNKHAARFGGINVKKSFVTSMFISGGLAGLAGCLHVLGVSHNMSVLSVTEGYGFDGIAVALIGGCTAIGNIWGGLFFGALKYGGTKIQPIMGAPSEVINIMIGTVVFFVSMPKIIDFALKFKFNKSKGDKNVR